jgi:hypothetical protein
MKTPNTTLTRIVAGLGFCGLAFAAAAQHYPAGAEGIKAATLPPTGLYFRDYNFFYWADDFESGPPGFDVFAYVNAPRLIWQTEEKMLGATFGMDIIVPFGYSEVEALGTSDDVFGLGDISLEPLLLSWHTKKFDFSAAYALWLPTGDFDRKDLANMGKGFFTHMFTAGATWYPDEQKSWAISLLNRYEINHEQDDTKITPGQTLTMEWGISKGVCKGVDVGLVGYWQNQITKNTGPGTRDDLAHVVALGPEIATFCEKLKLFATLRYNFEFAAKDRPEGSTITLTFTRPL